MYSWFLPLFEQLVLRSQLNKLHHALLLQGPAGIGKADFAKALASVLLCSDVKQNQVCGICQACKLYQAGNHPDFHEVLSDKQIGVDSIRDAIKKLSGSAQLSGAKVLIIYAAHTMTESSANALLKTLEEPTGNTFLLLVTHKAERLLPTIISRCERIIMPIPSLKQSLDWLDSEWGSPIDQEFAHLYANAPLSLLEELRSEQGLSYETFKSGLKQLLEQHVNPSKLATDWQEHAEKVLKWLQFWLHQKMLTVPGTAESLWHLHQEAINAVKRVRNPGVNKILVLNQLLSDIALSVKI